MELPVHAAYQVVQAVMAAAAAQVAAVAAAYYQMVQPEPEITATRVNPL
jgi:hypothetical protein